MAKDTTRRFSPGNALDAKIVELDLKIKLRK